MKIVRVVARDRVILYEYFFAQTEMLFSVKTTFLFEQLFSHCASSFFVKQMADFEIKTPFV